MGWVQIRKRRAKKDKVKIIKLFSDFFWIYVVPSHYFFLLPFLCWLFNLFRLSSDLLFSETASS